MTKIDILFRKISIQYDEEFSMEGVKPTDEEFNRMAELVRRGIRFPYTDAEFEAVRDMIKELRQIL